MKLSWGGQCPPYDRARMGMMGHGMRGGRHQTEEPQTLATFTYSGKVEPLSLPQQLIPVEALPAPKTVRQLKLNHGMFPGRVSGGYWLWGTPSKTQEKPTNPKH